MRHPDVFVFTDANFGQEVLESPKPVVVDFWSETCVPCRLQEPTIARMAEELRGQAKVGRLSVFENPAVLKEFQVKGVPHLMVIDKGEVVLELVGDHSIEQLRSHLRSVGLF